MRSQNEIFFQISAGFCGVWGVNSDQCVYYRLNTYADKDSEGTGKQCFVLSKLLKLVQVRMNCNSSHFILKAYDKKMGDAFQYLLN